jgi:hypothetical protein
MKVIRVLLAILGLFGLVYGGFLLAVGNLVGLVSIVIGFGLMEVILGGKI